MDHETDKVLKSLFPLESSSSKRKLLKQVFFLNNFLARMDLMEMRVDCFGLYIEEDEYLREHINVWIKSK